MPPRELSAPTPVVVLDARAELGEGPLWDSRRGVLWWLDILAGTVHAYDPAAGSDTCWQVGAAAGAAALDVDGRVILGLPDRLAVFDPADGSTTTIVHFAPGQVPLRCNDCRVDPLGRLWLGRMAHDMAVGAGSLVRVDRNGAVVAVLRGLTCPNGMAWPSTGGSFVFIDSPRRTLDRYPWDEATDSAGPPVPLLDLATLDLPPDAVPDGLAIDADDHLWLAVWGGGCLLRVAPDGTVVARVALPVSRPTSCAFGGPDLAELYVTSAAGGLDSAASAREPHAGGLFRIRPPVPGRPGDLLLRAGTGS
ncbi:MAG: SMP-30/gluconolactonase/LRE family protein [Chloroflexi bacterium]|jgi:sugar lactone lactonase YvrE|nr:SMP-30/gluconolactonase/LRE family protein [Chloroflexota bacterium]